MPEKSARELAPGDRLGGPTPREVTSVRRESARVLVGINGVPDALPLLASSSITTKGQAS